MNSNPVTALPLTTPAAWRGPNALPGLWRLVLGLGSLVAVLAVLWLGSTPVRALQDIELVHLLRAMALIKAAMVLPCLALVAWRFGRPITPALAMGYCVCLWSMAGAAVLVWQLNGLLFAAALFHLGLLGGALCALNDGAMGPMAHVLRRRSGRSRIRA